MTTSPDGIKEQQMSNVNLGLFKYKSRLLSKSYAQEYIGHR